jgi:uncharacterized membrane protein
MSEDLGRQDSRAPRSQAGDPFDVIVNLIPRHLWVSAAAVALMLLLGWLLFDRPDQPDRGAGRQEVLEGRVVEILASGAAGEGIAAAAAQVVAVDVGRAAGTNERVSAGYGIHQHLPSDALLSVGDRVLIEKSIGPDGERYVVSDFVRVPSLGGLLLLFALVATAVGGWVGIRALLSIGISVLAFVTFIIPGLLSGHDPLLVCAVGSLLLMTASLYLTYQWQWKTHIALTGLVIGVLVTVALASGAARFTHLTGLGTEEAAFIMQVASLPLDMRGLLLGGIVLGAVGVLDDVCIGQASAIFELKAANRTLTWVQLFHHGLVIGRDHIASMINTLLLAYVGASLPLFLLLAVSDLSLVQTLNREFLAEEIVRTLVGSLGLMLAVPITGLIASVIAERRLELK